MYIAIKPKKYRKKPVVIEAMLFKAGVNDKEVQEFVNATSTEGRTFRYHSTIKKYIIDTLEGQYEVIDNDVIIRGIKGECYPCKLDIFKATYEEIQ